MKNEKYVNILTWWPAIVSSPPPPKKKLPTWLSIKHGTFIHNIFCKLLENTLETTCGILIKRFSDHQPYFTLIENFISNNPTPKFVTVTKQDVESKGRFQD